jgi:1A family penicillin-binding protein
MIRQGKYTKKVTKFTRLKRSLKRRWRWFMALSKKKKALVISIPILAFLILTPLITYIYYFNDMGDQERLMNRNNTGIVLTDKNGETFYSVGRAEHRKLVALDDISKSMKDALIASEDKDFYSHGGFSIEGIGRAVYGTITSQSAYGGGSTITQQLVKNTLLTDEHSFFRKYQELAISVAIEQRYSKDQILDMYLNSAFFGGTTFGIEEAAKAYFNKSPKDLNLAESAMLVGILPAPNAYSPTLGNMKYAKERQETVLERMVTNGYITEQEKQAALVVNLTYGDMTSANDSIAPHFAEMVLEELYAKYGEETVLRSGYQVKTTLDLSLQRKFVANVSNHMNYVRSNGGSNAGGIAIDPTSGEIRALVGSADWNDKTWGKVNMATTARQPGSSFKPIYYSEALAEGIITPATVIADVATNFNGYTPQNASRTFSGNISVRNALSRSLNIPAVKVMEKLGIDNAVKAARRMGITSIEENKQYGLSLALGSAEAPLVEMTNAYAAFANQGNQYDVATIQQIKDKYDGVIFKSSKKSKSVISPQGAFLISSILSDNSARAPIFGAPLTISGRTAAVKTGTTDSQRDAWTIGYTPQLAVGVWVGNNNNDAMLNGGSGMAGPIWVNTMKQALEGVADTKFTTPSGIIQKPICYSNGGLANSSGTNTYNEYFLSSALPTTTCTAETAPVKTTEDTTKKTTTDTTKTTTDSSASGDTPTNSTGTTNNTSNTNTGTGTDTGSGTSGGNTGTGTTTPVVTPTPDAGTGTTTP